MSLTPFFSQFLRFEVILRSKETVPKILEKCQELGVQVEDYFETITKSWPNMTPWWLLVKVVP